MRFFPALALVFAMQVANAVEPLSREEVPDPLRSWVPWVLKGDDAASDATCAFFLGREERRCAWPAKLSLVLDERGGKFTQQWRVQRDEWVVLPGDAKRWPLDVRIDGAPAIVIDVEGEPQARLKAGDHVITGTFAWDSMPESLQVPLETGIVALSLRGTPVPRPNRDEDGLLYLSKTASAEQEENLELSVQRKVTDDIPLLLSTRIELHVSGKAREVLLGRALPEGFTPLSLESPLPARLEGDGRLRLQVRPGAWTLTLVARHTGPVEQLTRPKPDGAWSTGEEIWVFEPKPDLRLVTLEGVSSIDPQQTRLPDGWKELATYPMQLGDVLKLVEHRRGDANPAPDQLRLNRELWLDFDGHGYSVKDTLSGKMSRSTRLTMGPDTELGRVEISGRDQFITKLADGATGVEVRDAVLQVSADSRLPGARSNIPAVSWAHDFQAVSATLHLPPGWRLFHATGADEVPGTWVKRWTLMDFFLLLLTALAAARLFGPLWGALVLVTIVLTLHETDAPRWLWLAVLAGEALVRALAASRLQRALAVYRFVAAAALAIVAVVFLLENVRKGLYPSLERPHEEISFEAAFGNARPASPQEIPRPTSDGQMNEIAQEAQDQPGRANITALLSGERTRQLEKKRAETIEVIRSDKGGGWSGKGSGAASVSKSYANRQVVQDVDRTVKVQTGPGLPQWGWQQIAITWSGPVDHAQRLHLYYLSPADNFVLALLRLLLVTAVLLRLLPISKERWRSWLGRPPLRGGATLAIALALAGLLPVSARAELPGAELLQELRERLQVPPPCHPNCASSSRMALDASPTRLLLRLEVQVAASTAVPLPGHADQWVPDEVQVDGKAAAGLFRSSEGVLWLPLSTGAHQVLLQGALPSWESIQIALPLRPHWVQAKLAGWSLAGLHEDGLADPDLQLTRLRGSSSHQEVTALQSATLPPFVQVRRTVSLGLDWQVDTQVSRLSPEGSAVVLEVPLLPGESVTTPEVRVSGGKAMVNLGAQEQSVEWHSTLTRAETLQLTAPKEVVWVEEWRLDISPLWHAKFSGIPPVHRQDARGEQVPEFRPWPGETVSVQVERPGGVAGQTLTIDQTNLVLRPGVRATDASLEIGIRSSRGGQHDLLLPERAELQSVKVNGREQPIRQEGRKVTLPITPGAQHATLTWHEPRGMGLVFRSSNLDVGAATVNSHTEVHVPRSRWVLFVHGPRLGPSVLFWSALLVLLLVSVGLSRTMLAPLRLLDWVLLSLGLSQVPVAAGMVVAGWLLFLGWRGKDTSLQRWVFNLRQLLVLGWSAAALGVLAFAVHEGLLGMPDMQVGGNGSSASVLRWFQDRTGPLLASSWTLSVPVSVYRIAMLLWALWLARSLLKWLRWGWECFNSGGLWRPRPPPAIPVAPPSA